MNFSAMTDGQLLSEFLDRGSEEAFEQLVRRHSAMVLGVCRYAACNACDCEDIVQIVFVTLARKAHLLTEHVSLAGWLHRAAWYTARRAHRALRIHHAHERAAAAACAAVQRDREATEQTKEEVYRALDALPDRYREVLILHHIEGCGVQQTALLLAIPITTVQTRLHRGREMLRETLLERGLAFASVPAILELLALEETRAGAPFGFSSTTAATGMSSPLVAGPLLAGADDATGFTANMAYTDAPALGHSAPSAASACVPQFATCGEVGVGSNLALSGTMDLAAVCMAADLAGVAAGGPAAEAGSAAFGTAAMAATHLSAGAGVLAAVLVFAATVVTAIGVAVGSAGSGGTAGSASHSILSAMIPEPGTLALLVVGAIGLVRRPKASRRTTGGSRRPDQHIAHA